MAQKSQSDARTWGQGFRVIRKIEEEGEGRLAELHLTR